MISVIIPIYNVERYLDKCLSSVLTNTYRDLEVICVNDGATDSCPEIIKKWQKQDPRIVVVDQKNLGLEAARNSGLDAATGDYIAFIDADDFVHPRYFELLFECMENTDADMVVCGVKKFTEDEEANIDPNPEPHYQKLTSEQLYKSYFPRRMVWGRLMRSCDAQKLRFPVEVRAAQDSLYNLRLIAGWEHPNIYEFDTPLYYYLQRPGSRIHSHPYETTIAIADWYVKHERDPHHLKTGPWSWILLLQSITTTLVCRYQAKLRRNHIIKKQTNSLLRPMVGDLIKDKQIRSKYKIILTIMYLLPEVYRRFRLWDDPSLKQIEKEIKRQLQTPDSSISQTLENGLSPTIAA